jgi:hypothetical protein
MKVEVLHRDIQADISVDLDTEYLDILQLETEDAVAHQSEVVE